MSNRRGSTFGLTTREVESLEYEHARLCAICRQRPPEQNLAIDHDHTTGRVRGLLCRSCNLGLGFFKDNVDLLRKAIAYLEHHNDTDLRSYPDCCEKCREQGVAVKGERVSPTWMHVFYYCEPCDYFWRCGWAPKPVHDAVVFWGEPL